MALAEAGQTAGAVKTTKLCESVKPFFGFKMAKLTDAGASRPAVWGIYVHPTSPIAVGVGGRIRRLGRVGFSAMATGLMCGRIQGGGRQAIANCPPAAPPSGRR